MKKRYIIIAIAITLLTACQKEIVTNPANGPEKTIQENKDNDKNDKVKTKTVDIIGTLSGTSMIVPSSSCAYGFMNIGQGKGVSTSFGAFTFSNSDCLGTMFHTVFTYPNGDKAYTTQVSESVNPFTGLPVQDAIFTGGTGRFAGATGSSRLYITKFEPTARPGVYNVAGVFTGSVTILHKDD
jgi:hypothetical protein